MVVEAFFWRGRALAPEETEKLPNLLLLSGPPSCGKTSLLFQFAFNVAISLTNSTTSNVFFICNRHKLDSKPPFLSQGIDGSSDVFNRIQMKYVNGDEDINKYFAAFHLYDVLPAAVIIDDFADFFDNRICQERHCNPRGRDLAMVRSLALCHNAINYANKKGSCKLLLSDTYHGDSPRLHFIYKKWIPSMFTIKEGDEAGSFTLTDRSSSGTKNPDGTKVAKMVPPSDIINKKTLVLWLLDYHDFAKLVSAIYQIIHPQQVTGKIRASFPPSPISKYRIQLN